MTTCPCTSGKDYDDCCGPVLAGAPAPTAEALMRSRYTAYVRGAVDHILDSCTPEAARGVDRASTERWSRSATWLGLDVVATGGGGPSDDEGTVEFVARFRDGPEGEEKRHHEHARFVRGSRDRRWLYAQGRVVGVPPVRREEHPGRNEPCSCGSGKKYKKCHGA
jgi:SEC-C motif-containing protein